MKPEQFLEDENNWEGEKSCEILRFERLQGVQSLCRTRQPQVEFSSSETEAGKPADMLGIKPEDYKKSWH